MARVALLISTLAILAGCSPTITQSDPLWERLPAHVGERAQQRAAD